MQDHIRIGCAVPSVSVANIQKNTRDICDYIAKANAQSCDLVIFPELSVTGYTCGDLFFQQILLRSAAQSIHTIAKSTVGYPNLLVVVGAPLMLEGRTYDCAVVLSGGVVRGMIPKLDLSLAEHRWFSAEPLPNLINGIPVGEELLFSLKNGSSLMVTLGTAQKGSADVVANLTAAPALAGSRRREKAATLSHLRRCVYATASAGCTESNQDVLYSGHSIILENGNVLAERKLETDYLLIADADCSKVRGLAHDEAELPAPVSHALRPDPFCSGGPERWLEIFQIQTAGLARRLQQLGCKPVIGVSGGLDSTLALLVVVEAVKKNNRPASDVCAVTMPGFGTSGRTYENAQKLMQLLGVGIKEIDIRSAVELHFQNIGHDITNRNATYENAQARERTQILMDYASTVGGIVVGTGDLSELALGWCTYNGDHMSMYGVNASVPKTLIPHIIHTVMELPDYRLEAPVLQNIIDTPISPELLPPDAAGKLTQQTEDLVGPYALHDFFLYYTLRYATAPDEVYNLACRAFDGQYEKETIKKWLKVFYRRFFSQQFKRNCMPEGAKVGSVSLNPRGDWSMPSNATADLWLSEVEKL